ncbi:MAG TPA: VOC family protein, partial [Gemmatimonadaceae bacterium]|nr:VOC family protein [Gemmatimonadaceae bacterium]
APAGFRLPDDTRLGRVRLQVADLSRSRQYYEQVLGMRVLSRADAHAVLGTQDGATPLVELHERPGARAVPRRGLLGLYHVAILLPDRAALGRFLAHLASLGVPAGMSDHLVSEAVYLQDPDNLGIEVYADRPRESWMHHARELAMTTKPLDARSVVAAANGEPWTGMPAGTTIGHVHLHVGDIDEGARFYHERLGFDKVVWSYPGALFLSAGGYHHHLGTNVWARGAPPAGPEDARLLDWEIVLPPGESLEELVASAGRDGSLVTQDTNSALLRDPWGTVVRVTSDPSRV